jgi:oligopeptide transport system substrate-binding protein
MPGVFRSNFRQQRHDICSPRLAIATGTGRVHKTQSEAGQEMRKPRLLFIKILCVAIALSLFLSGCSSSDSEPSDISIGGTLNLYDIGPSSLDPAIARGDDSLAYIVEIFSGLVCFNPDLELIPDIAESWEKSSDGTTYTFHLRSGVKFHDGKKVTASDFKYSMERVCDPVIGSQTAETYLGDIAGAKEKLSGKAKEVSGIKVIDDYTLQITIDAPKEYFLSKLAYPTAFVVDKANVESGKNWWKNPNGTGPFKLKEWQENSLITLERNDKYYLEPAKVSRVVYHLWSGIPMMLYESDEIDVTAVYLSDIERVLDPSNPLNKELYITPGFSLSYIGFNSSKPPFDDAKVRQAFCYAVDKDKIINLVLKGTVRRADGILPPGMPGYSENIHGLSYNPELARQLIAESKYSDLSVFTPLILTSMGLGTASSIEAALVDMWRDNLGVEVEIRQLEPEKYFYVLMAEKDEMFTSGWGADYPDPQNFLDILFHSGTEDNIGEYYNTTADALFEKARVETNLDKRTNLYQQAEQLIVDEAACLPLFFDISYTLVKPYVKNLPLTPLWIPRLRYVSIEHH